MAGKAALLRPGLGLRERLFTAGILRPHETRIQIRHCPVAVVTVGRLVAGILCILPEVARPDGRIFYFGTIALGTHLPGINDGIGKLSLGKGGCGATNR